MALRDPAAGGSKSEIKTAAKHVVIADGRLSDGGSIPPASTILRSSLVRQHPINRCYFLVIYCPA